MYESKSIIIPPPPLQKNCKKKQKKTKTKRRSQYKRCDYISWQDYNMTNTESKSKNS